MANKNKERRSTDNLKRSPSIICEGSILKGELSGDADFFIYGSINGECDLNGTLMIQKPGQWKGNIVADDIVISGTVEGDVSARNKLEITATAKITGNITGNTIAIAEGAVFEGKISMTKKDDVSYFEERRVEPADSSPAG